MARLRPDQLAGHLKKQLAPVYLISGDEPLLIQEAADAIRQHAKSQGFRERELHHTDGGFTWDELMHSANSLSLFADKKIIEIRVHNGKPGDAGSKALQAYCQAPSDDNLLMLILPKVEKASQSAKWFKAIENCGVVVQVWPIGANELPRWVDHRLKAAGLQASSEAIDILCVKVEGNLLAAAQEIEKLKLVANNEIIDAETMASCVMESARYDVFSLVNRALNADTSAVIRILNGLKGEGTEPPVVLWALSRELRILAAMKTALDSGQPFDLAAKQNQVWSTRKPLVKQAINRLSQTEIMQLVELCSFADRSIKGAAKHNTWLLLQDITLGLCGSPALSASSLQQTIHSYQ